MSADPTENEMQKQMKVRITWNGMGGELDSVTVDFNERSQKNEESLTNALVKMISGNIVSPGDSFTVEEIKASA